VLRSAEAMGADGVLLSADCVDLFGPKTLRAAMGAVFRLPVAVCEDLAADIGRLRGRGLACYASVVWADAQPVTGVDFSRGGLIVVGNEARGVSETMRTACGEVLTIPMRGRAESLNAAAAAALLLWELCGR